MSAVNFSELTGVSFEHALRIAVEDANYATKGSHPSPWEVIMEAVIALEKRIESSKETP